MSYRFLTLDVDDGVGVISLNRPDRILWRMLLVGR